MQLTLQEQITLCYLLFAYHDILPFIPSLHIYSTLISFFKEGIKICERYFISETLYQITLETYIEIVNGGTVRSLLGKWFGIVD